MKYTLLFLLLPLIGFSQDEGTQDQLSTLFKFKKETEANIQNIQLNLTKSHQSYKAGLAFVVIGTVFTTTSLFVVDSENLAPYFFLAGTGIVCYGIGSGFLISSRIYIGRAGRRVSFEVK